MSASQSMSTFIVVSSVDSQRLAVSSPINST